MRTDIPPACHAQTEEMLRRPVPDVIPEEGTTTLMVRNLPRNYTANAIMREIDQLSLTIKYDMVYVPWDTRRSSNISYAFVNFLDHESAMRAFFALSGRVWSFVRTTKSCKLATAHIQGVPENLANYVANFGMTCDCPHAPTVFHNGMRIHWMRAVKLLCTDQMIARASEAAQSKKIVHKPDIGNGEPKTQSQLAIGFKESFLQFRESLAQSHDKFVDMDRQTSFGEESLDHSQVDFWLRFRDLCLQLPSKPSTMPLSRIENLESKAVAHPPGLIQSSQNLKRLTVQKEMPFVSCPSLRNCIGLKCVGHEAGYNEGIKAIVDSHVPDPRLFLESAEGHIPLPKWLIADRRGL